MHASFLAVLSCVSVSAQTPGLLDQHDLVWEVAPARWLTGIPLANGDIGALVWGDGAPLKITLDKYDAWETREAPLDLSYEQLRQLVRDEKREEAEQAMRTQRLYGDGPRPTRLPMPRLEIDFGGAVEWGRARLRLHTASAEIDGAADGDGASLKGDGASLKGDPFHIELFVHANENLLVIRIEGAPAARARFSLGLRHLDADAKATLERWGYPAPAVAASDDKGSLALDAPTGYRYAIAWQRHVSDDGNAHTVLLSLLSSADADDPLAAARARVANPETDVEAHRAWWAAYWERSWLTIPDARLEALYYAEMYKLGCCSRPGKFPVTLQGLWTLDGGMPPWAGDYHLDMNVQQSYWPIYTANRLELGEPLYRAFSACLPRWQEQCRAFFGFDGIWSGCAIGPKGERIYGYSGVELWPGNAAWLAHHYWLHYLYSQDAAFLRDQALPIMRLAFLTYANLLEEGDDGRLHVPLSYSPEYGEGGFSAYCKDPTCDLALIRFLGKAILEANAALEAEDALTERIASVLERLVDYPQRGNKLMVSAGTPLGHSHRHHSHLMAIHPLGLLSPEGTDVERALIRGSLHEIRVHGPGEWTGWAFPWMSLIASRAGLGNMAWQMLDTYANAFIKPNTFHVNGDPRVFGLSLFEYEPMTLEAGFGAAAAVMEMLLQSYNGRIRLFPSVPDRWHDAYFEDLRAEGAFLVTAKLERGDVRFLKVASEAGRPCSLVNPFQGGAAELLKLDAPDAAPTPLTGDAFTFDTHTGGRYLLYPAGRKPDQEDFSPVRFPRAESDAHFYGLKRLPRF